MDWTIGPVRIAVPSGEIFIPGWNSDLFSIDCQLAEFSDGSGLGYNITHVKTGMKVCIIDGVLQDAKDFCEFLAGETDWSLVPLDMGNCRKAFEASKVEFGKMVQSIGGIYPPGASA